MKLATKEEIEEHQKATIRGALEGSLGSAAVALPTFYLMNKRWPYYRSLPPSLKLLGLIIVVAPCLSIQAERRGLEYDKSTWTGAGKAELEREAAERERRWQQLSLSRRITEWTVDHQYSLIVAGWALSVGIAGAVVWRRPFETPTQKIVQVRMWAQGSTMLMMLAAGILTAQRRKESMDHRGEDHSWMQMLDEQKKEEEARKVKAIAA
ncbi:hypothetical protein PLICRDRAFT_34127 [Plicaturopsis crispa FD-325 SS-3]|nr:hypothetical protein PLICRDRAFT_34127 [Plicaturopsis crispa FD-325 SS-3]